MPTRRHHTRTASFRLCIILLLMLPAAVCHAGETGDKLTPPAHLPPLPANWKETVYEAMNKHATEKNRQANVRYLFLDPPVPCTATLGRKGVLGIGFGKSVQQGYGGVVLKKMIDGYSTFGRKRKSVEKDATVYFYLLMPDTGKVEAYSVEQMEHGRVAPPVVTVETTQVRNGREIRFRAMMSPQANREAAAFRAIADVETFDAWPPYK